MVVMRNKKTGFFCQLNRPDEVFCYNDVSEIPKDFKGLPDIEAEYLDDHDIDPFVTELYNLGIRRMNGINGRIYTLRGCDAMYIRPRYIERLLSEFVVEKRMEGYNALFGQEAYFLIRFHEDGTLSTLNIEWSDSDEKQSRFIPMAFPNYGMAHNFLRQEGIGDRRPLLFRMPEPCVLMGNDCQILLERKEKHG